MNYCNKEILKADPRVMLCIALPAMAPSKETHCLVSRAGYRTVGTAVEAMNADRIAASSSTKHLTVNSLLTVQSLYYSRAISKDVNDMARPKDDEREDRIMEAAIRIIASGGLGAPTAAIAKAAGVSNGSLFTYFETNAALLNRCYVTLKAEMSTAIADIDPEASNRDQLRQVWHRWLRWAAANFERRKVLALLMVSEDITTLSREKGDSAMAPIVSLLDRCRADGVLSSAPMALVGGLVIAMAEATMDSIAHDPTDADAQEALVFEALWRALT